MAFIEFNPFLLLSWVFLTSFLPGTLLSLALFKKDERFGLLEKILLGFAIGFMMPAIIAFLLSVFGVKFSYGIAIFSSGLFFIASLALFAKQKAYEGIALPNFKEPRQFVIPIILAVIIFLSFWIRMQSYSPIFQELDPYYYVYSAQQLIVFGEHPFNDGTAWYPDAEVNHRSAPVLHFMEAIWYSFYTQGGEYNNYLLYLVAGLYPPMAAALMAFFIYLLVSTHYKKEYGLLSAVLVSFAPIFLLKMAAGEPEVQPYAFFSLAFFLAAYGLMLKTKDMRFALLASLAYAGVLWGSSSSIVAISMLIIFIPLQSLLLYLKEKKREELLDFVKLNLVVVFLGLLLSNAILDTYGSGHFNTYIFFNKPMFAVLGTLVFGAFLYYVKGRVSDFETSMYVLAGVLIVGMIAILFTPFGDIVKSIAASGLQFAEFNYALQQTIAEQGVAGSVLEDQIGFAAKIIFPTEGRCDPLIGPTKPLECALGSVLNMPFNLLSSAVNSFIPGATYGTKENSIALVLFFFYFISIIFSLYKNWKHEHTVFLFFFALFPLTFVGILKAKFTIYTGFFLAVFAGVAFAEMEELFRKLAEKFKFNVKIDKYDGITIVMLLLAAGLAYSQFSYQDFAPSILASSLTPRFQDNPALVAPKFKAICDQLKFQGQFDEAICGAGNDPVGYASKGINYQYDQRLCAFSLVTNLASATKYEQQAISYRCTRVSDYWIESMEWIRDNTEKDAKITSWWDYGHWENFFGQRAAVIRNDHSSTRMIGEVANAFVAGTEEDLKGSMKSFNSKYVLIDNELVLGGLFGGKFGALNYLSCARNNETFVRYNPSSSICEVRHRWEIIYVPTNATVGCTISESSNKTGVIAYRMNFESDAVTGQITRLSPVPTYCVGEATFANGQKTQATYLLDKKYDNGDLKLNKGLINVICQTSDGFNCVDKGQLVAAVMLYTKEPIWLENGEIKTGYEDRVNSGTYFYDSNLYKGWFLKDLGPDFEFVFQTKNAEVKIYKLKD